MTLKELQNAQEFRRPKIESKKLKKICPWEWRKRPYEAKRKEKMLFRYVVALA